MARCGRVCQSLVLTRNYSLQLELRRPNLGSDPELDREPELLLLLEQQLELG